ncbi:DUF1178 family protein [Sphingomonas sp. MMS12-HWE2-04]|uniref:DUF1178 family protein n=1 Tax=Sphingomonas sp. MMS12-HWE2-04 TaxID=3234199 RepID=UPI00384B5D19
MIVFDLRCPAEHVFEAWFGSSTAYEEQRAAGLVACPLCGSAEIGKAVMAPNVAAKGNRAVAAPVSKSSDAPPEMVKAAIAALAEVQAAMLAQSQWVGGGFASKARAMHLGEEPAAPIHGQATIAEAKELIDEGVPVAPLPLPFVPPEQRN